MLRWNFRFPTVKSGEIDWKSDRIHPDFSLFRRQNLPGPKKIGRGNFPCRGKENFFCREVRGQESSGIPCLQRGDSPEDDCLRSVRLSVEKSPDPFGHLHFSDHCRISKLFDQGCQSNIAWFDGVVMTELSPYFFPCAFIVRKKHEQKILFHPEKLEKNIRFRNEFCDNEFLILRVFLQSGEIAVNCSRAFLMGSEFREPDGHIFRTVAFQGRPDVCNHFRISLQRPVGMNV